MLKGQEVKDVIIIVTLIGVILETWVRILDSENISGKTKFSEMFHPLNQK